MRASGRDCKYIFVYLYTLYIFYINIYIFTSSYTYLFIQIRLYCLLIIISRSNIVIVFCDYSEAFVYSIRRDSRDESSRLRNHLYICTLW